MNAEEMAKLAYVSDGPTEVSPLIIALILEVALTVAKDCLTKTGDAKVVLRAGRQRSILARFAIRLAIRKTGTKEDKEKIITTVFRMCDMATVEQLKGFASAAY